MKSISFNNFTNEISPYKMDLKKAFNEVLDSGWYILGKQVEKFETVFSDYLDIKYCIGVGNGLEALQISLMALGVKGGDEVVTTPISAVATTLAILAAGAKPVFVDTTEDGLMDPSLVEKAITKKTKAILPVHLYGNSVDLKSIKNICKKYKIFLIEDACQAHGANFGGRKLGTIGDIGCFSFYPTKNLGTFGDGGAIVTSSKKIAQICREIRNYGEKDKYLHVRYGLNSRLDELHATFLLVKLKYLDSNNNKRRNLAKRYIKKLSNITGISFVVPQMKDSNFHLFVIKTIKRDKLQNYLKRNGIQSLVHYPKTIPDQPFLKNYKNSNIPIARKFVKNILSLPCNPTMSLDQIDYVCKKIKEFFL